MSQESSCTWISSTMTIMQPQCSDCPAIRSTFFIFGRHLALSTFCFFAQLMPRIQIYLKVPYSTHFRIMPLFWVSTRKPLYALVFRNAFFFFFPHCSLLQHLYAPSVWTLHLSDCLLKPLPSRNVQFVLIGHLSHAWTGTVLHVFRPISAGVLTTAAVRGGVPEGGGDGCSVVTSQP